jgi:phosphoglycolate phosphatase-like HAD superfamily hydrolase
MNSDMLIVLDMDGTITKPDFRIHGTWARIDKATLDPELIGATEFVRRHFMEVMRGRGMTDHDHQTWFEMSHQAWREGELKRQDLEKIFKDNADHLRPGLKEFLAWLKSGRSDFDIKVIINTYGASQASEIIVRNEGASNLVDGIFGIPLTFTVDGTLDAYDEHRLVTAEMKGTVTSLAMQQWNIAPDRVIGIGDSSGDRFLAPVHRLLIAEDEDHVQRYHKHFSDHVIASDWEAVQLHLKHKFGM